jgi:hypothetical protein
MALVSNGVEDEAPGGMNHQGPDAPLAHRRAGYPSSGCVPAEPESVSPATWEFSESREGKKASSAESVGEFRLREFPKSMI